MTESIRVRNAKGRYLESIRDGMEGVIEFFTPFPERNPERDIQILRSIEDGDFVHAYQNLDDGAARWMTADFFDTDRDGRIVEHRDVQEKVAPRETWNNAGKF